jgi:hypothetical protein
MCAPGKVDPVYPFPSGHPEPAAATTHASDLLYGPWRPAPNVPGVNNPAVFFWSNGTAAIYDRTSVTWSDSINGPWANAVRCSFYGRIGVVSPGVLSVVVPAKRAFQLIACLSVIHSLIRIHFHLPSPSAVSTMPLHHCRQRERDHTSLPALDRTPQHAFCQYHDAVSSLLAKGTRAYLLFRPWIWRHGDI